MKLYVLVGQNSDTSYTILASWSKLPTQEAIDTITTKTFDKYRKFAVMEDILFIEGSEEDTSSFYY